MILLASMALATSGFDPLAPQAVFNGEETYTADGTLRLWAEIARYDDPDRTLFGEVVYNELTAWPEGDAYAPWIAECFGTAEPPASSFLLHVAPNVGLARGTPILFVPGAGDNASRGFITMAWHMDLAGRPSFAVTFPHAHGDVYQQAELLADAIAAVRARTGAEQVDVVAHSKGGIATAVYLSHHAGSGFPAPYADVGTPYRGDVRKAVLIATPLAGIDTSYRWPAGNYAALDADTAYSPSSWSTWYPYTTASPWTAVDLADQDFLPDGADLFPGHRQLLARQPYPLPGELPALGAYALQPDWYTTYEGGLGYQSDSEGIDAAVAAGGNLLDTLARAGVDPGVRLYLLAGNNPIMPNGADALLTEWFGEGWVDLLGQSASRWAELVADLVGDSLIAVGVTEAEVQGLAQGDLVLGEISGESDGLVFVSSATAAASLTARGAEVVDTEVVDLSHLDLLYASPITGELLIEDAATDDALAWEAALGQRYIDADTIGWVEAALAEDPSGGDSGSDDSGADPGDDSGADPGGDSGDPSGDSGADPDDLIPLDADGEQYLGCGSCSTGSGPAAWTWLAAFAALVWRRRCS